MKRKGPLYACVIFLAVLVIAAPLELSAQSKKVRDQARKLAEQAQKASQQKDFRQAAELYAQAISLLPNNPDLHYRKGFAHIELKENDKAINDFTLALNKGFKPPIEIYRIRSYVFYEVKNYDAALEDLRKGMAIAPNDLPFLKMMGEINMDRKAFPAALEAFQKASKMAPDDADVHYNMARVYFALGDAKAQGTEADLALSKGTRFPGEAHYLAGDARQKQGNLVGAIDAYQKAINSKPDIYQAYINLAEVYRNENRFNDAISISKQGLRNFPNDGAIYTSLSEFYSLADRPEDAVQAAKAGITLLPNRYLAYTNLCRAENTLKNYGDAIAACNSALNLQPDDGETNYYLGNAYVGLGRSVEATNRYTRAVNGLTAYTEKYPNLSDGWYLLGNALFADKQYDRSIEAYLKCLSLSPKFLRARVNLGIVYTRKKNKAAAVEQYNLVLPADAALAARLKAEIDKM
ncbi:MAG: tetratricopeptide repeat protein [Chloracidobacterium sp.]|nr:tetratricopeptide repeat protein [Chloracidobacterium sp.]